MSVLYVKENGEWKPITSIKGDPGEVTQEEFEDLVGEVLNKSQITNCLLEVPQRIKLELSNGTLTLKAGSEVIIPNGFEADGTTPKFDYVTISENRTNVQTSNGKYLVFASNTGTTIFVRDVDRVESGATRTLNLTYSVWYDTTNNLVQNYGANATTSSGTASFPLALITVSNGAISSIDQVFNGMGYIGSTVWVDKGVKGLIPNGRNEDGSLNNKEFTTSKIMTRNFTGTWQALLGANANATSPLSVSAFLYNFGENINISKENGTVWSHTTLAELSITNGVITNFQPKLPFRAVDYNDYTKDLDTKVNKSGDTMTGQLNIITINSTPLTLRTTKEESETYNEIQFQDHSGVRRNTIRSHYEYDDNGVIQKSTFTIGSNKLNGSAPQGLALTCGTNGTITTSAPTPATSDNSTKIATTAWVHNNSATIASWSMPSSRYTNLTLGASPSTYTAPANGWVYFRRTVTSVGQYIQLVNDTRSSIQSWIQSGTSSGILATYIPVQKGDQFSLSYTLGSNANQLFRFVYAQGEV